VVCAGVLQPAKCKNANAAPAPRSIESICITTPWPSQLCRKLLSSSARDREPDGRGSETVGGNINFFLQRQNRGCRQKIIRRGLIMIININNKYQS